MNDRYITNADYRRQKSALTRAVNSGDAVKVLTACEKVLVEWTDKVWPDDWARWARAADDAWFGYRRTVDSVDPSIENRFLVVFDELC